VDAIFAARVFPEWPTGTVAKGKTFPSHHPQFDLAEDALPPGAATLSVLAMEYLAP
jgi:metal-dependent amidase/aminoacylase/carboxypeptidase family protein